MENCALSSAPGERSAQRDSLLYETGYTAGLLSSVESVNVIAVCTSEFELAQKLIIKAVDQQKFSH